MGLKRFTSLILTVSLTTSLTTSLLSFTPSLLSLILFTPLKICSAAPAPHATVSEKSSANSVDTETSHNPSSRRLSVSSASSRVRDEDEVIDPAWAAESLASHAEAVSQDSGTVRNVRRGLAAVPISSDVNDDEEGGGGGEEGEVGIVVNGTASGCDLYTYHEGCEKEKDRSNGLRRVLHGGKKGERVTSHQEGERDTGDGELAEMDEAANMDQQFELVSGYYMAELYVATDVPVCLRDMLVPLTVYKQCSHQFDQCGLRASVMKHSVMRLSEDMKDIQPFNDTTGVARLITRAPYLAMCSCRCAVLNCVLSFVDDVLLGIRTGSFDSYVSPACRHDATNWCKEHTPRNDLKCKSLTQDTIYAAQAAVDALIQLEEGVKNEGEGEGVSGEKEGDGEKVIEEQEWEVQVSNDMDMANREEESEGSANREEGSEERSLGEEESAAKESATKETGMAPSQAHKLMVIDALKRTPKTCSCRSLRSAAKHRSPLPALLILFTVLLTLLN